MCVKLLIADDEDMIRNGIAKYIKLHTDRYETIYLAKNGQEALDIIYRHKPDIMLLDVQMPHKDGIELMQEAYRAGVLPCTIILSGYDEFRYAQQAIRLGARDYLLKPSRSSDILKKLNAIADEKFKEPEEPVLLPEGRNQIVERAKDYLEEHYYEDLSLTEVAEYWHHGKLPVQSVLQAGRHEVCGLSQRGADRPRLYLSAAELSEEL